MHFVCTAYTESACTFVVGFTVCIVSTRESAFSVTADRKNLSCQTEISVGCTKLFLSLSRKPALP